MTVQLLIEWGRAKSGRVWHLLSPRTGDGRDVTFCEEEAVMIEVTHSLPPFGARPCPRCAEVVEALTFAVLQAQQQKSPRTNTSETLDDDPRRTLD